MGVSAADPRSKNLLEAGVGVERLQGAIFDNCDHFITVPDYTETARRFVFVLFFFRSGPPSVHNLLYFYYAEVARYPFASNYIFIMPKRPAISSQFSILIVILKILKFGYHSGHHARN